jgi:endonuclease YncB( thermonuclease family)
VSAKITLSSYGKLHTAIVRRIATGAARIRGAYRQEVVRTHWQIGRILNGMLDLGNKPAGRNAAWIRRLARDLKRPETFFYAVAKFQRLYPAVPGNGLSWAHYALLIGVENEKERGRFETQAARERLSVKDLGVRVRSRSRTRMLPETPAERENGRPELKAVRGRLYYYKTFRDPAHLPAPGRVFLDAGFGVERQVRAGNAAMRSGQIVRAVKAGEEYSVRRSPYELDWLYTYTAVVKHVADGDTLTARIDLGFRTWITEILRLRGIDCPEMSSTAGRAAAMFVRKTLAKCPCFVVKTYKDEKFGRMLADVYYKQGEPDPVKVLSEGTYLNQELLDRGYAVLYEP